MKIVYKTYFGSKLYGTDNPESDTDYKGIFIPDLKDVILKKDIEHFNTSTGNKQSKNSKDDVDTELWSIYKFLELLKKGETGAIDLLFSMFREDTIVEKDDEVVEWFKNNAYKFITKNSKTFVGYCLGQAQRYGVKGSRYGDLIVLKDLLDNFDGGVASPLVKSLKFEDFVKLHDQIHNLKYCQLVTINELKYLSVLGKNYQLTAPYEIVKNAIMSQYNSYGERSKKANEECGVDWKALSHAFRVIFELDELLDARHLVFPLQYAEDIKNIKAGKVDLDLCLTLLSNHLENLQKKIDKSTLPSSVDQNLIDECILKFVV